MKHPRFRLYITPFSRSWLNLVERCWFGELTTKKIKRGALTGIQSLAQGIRDWIVLRNEYHHPYVWTKTANKTLETFARYYERISNSGH